ncbi:MAG TPA: ROK family protein, partial [Elainellaceae cyanobacterium]
MTSLLLALDFGGTKHAAATTTIGSTQWLAYCRALSPPDANQETDLQIMRSLIHDVLNGKRPDAVGVSFGGPVDFTTGTVRLSHHVSGWENVPLQAWLEDEIGVPVSVDNDANVAALGESRFGAGQPYDSLLYVTISTGVGGGWILNKQPWRGSRGMAGEIGHTVVDPSGPICLCGKQGCVERLASGPYLAHDAIAHLQEHPNQGAILRELVNHQLSTITAQHISEAANRGDEVAQLLIKRAGWAIGVAIGNAANL